MSRALCAVGLVLACHGGSATPDASPPADASPPDALTAASACADTAAAMCQMLATCSPADLERRFTTEAICEARDQLACLAALNAPGTGATPEANLACGSAWIAQTCDAFYGDNPPDGCNVASGAGSNGATCAVAAECASGYCALDSHALCGTCADEPTVGTSCAEFSCGPTLVCVAKVCAQPAAVNAPCSATAPCATGLTCVGAGSSTPGSCVTSRTTADAVCDPTHATGPDCDSHSGLACDTVTNLCEAFEIVGPGSQCGTFNGLPVRCDGGAACAVPHGQTTGTCIAPAKDGGKCDISVGPGCLAPAKCIPSTGSSAGTCELPDSTACE